ncbi:MAG: CDP-diacylglycerol--serine O-phosphatidyltransferase [Deltaproteobacteria bacterium RBG_16_58_17]|nr:MAG: CDP-diacylglycerol--serine O-phosphatidyltransferase [Deltaproteobacteria bacterium RBG_16_58_17]OHE18379.1 MAG: CDP-diacylglycerol--serine O-phosphatidyltransferase [Syntrophobacterales bacterium GWC2_56_13]OHE20252.1 MAG: CDP-diacylglycerol--serine O-phosphatidyltransferase [Syntrophobacterales bacterium GWF2_56_9]
MKKVTPLRRDRMKVGIYVLPNLFTTANLFCGFYSIIAAMKGLYEIAAVSILIAVVLDGLDGRIARMTHTTSKFGGEYDSLCDLVTFGVAPALLVYSWSLISYGKWGWLAAFLFVACGALRLARFNVQVGIIDSRVFNGLPIPGGAAAVATGVLLYYYLGGDGRFSDLSIMFLVIALSLFMVSSIKYYSFKDLNFFSRKPFMSFVLIIVILVIVVAEPQIMLFTFAFGYGFSGPAGALFKLGRKFLTDIRTKKSQYQDHLL